MNVFNVVVENGDYFLKKWEEQIKSKDVLKKVIAKRFIEICGKAKPIEQFDVDLYIKLTEKITVYEGKLVASLLDGSDVECKIE